MFQAMEPDQPQPRVCLTVELKFGIFNCLVREGDEGTRNGAISLSLSLCVRVCLSVRVSVCACVGVPRFVHLFFSD